MSNRFRVSLEDGDETPEVAVPEQEGDLAGDNTVEAGLIEVQEAEVEVAADEAAVETLEQDQAALESLLVSMEASMADGGLTAGEAVYARHALQAIVGKYGADVSHTVSVESFGAASSRRQATVSMENAVIDFIKSIWEKIKSFFKKMWAKLRGWYDSNWSTAARLKARAEAIKKKAGDLQGSMDAKDFELGVLKQLHIGGKYPNDLRAEFGKVSTAVADGLSDKSSTQYETLADNIVNAAEQAVEAKTDAVRNSIAGFVTKASNIFKATGAKDKRYSDKVFVVKSGELLGGKMLVERYADTNKISSFAELADAVSACGVSFDVFAEKSKDVDSSGTFKTLEKGVIENLAGDVAALCNTILDYKKGWEARNKMEDRIVKAGNKLEADVAKDKEMKESAKREVVGAMRAITRIGLLSEKHGAPFMTEGLNTGKAVLTACERSLAQYKKA